MVCLERLEINCNNVPDIIDMFLSMDHLGLRWQCRCIHISHANLRLDTFKKLLKMKSLRNIEIIYCNFYDDENALVPEDQLYELCRKDVSFYWNRHKKVDDKLPTTISSIKYFNKIKFMEIREDFNIQEFFDFVKLNGGSTTEAKEFTIVFSLSTTKNYRKQFSRAAKEICQTWDIKASTPPCFRFRTRFDTAEYEIIKREESLIDKILNRLKLKK